MSAPAEDPVRRLQRDAIASRGRWWLDDVNDAVPYDSPACDMAAVGWRQRDVLVDVLMELGSQGADVQEAVRRVLARRAQVTSPNV